jgi:hypothetical protein
MRRLIVVPIVHTAADLGSLAGPLRERYLRALGPSAWQQHERAVERLWNTIGQRIDSLHLDYRTVVIYQDGLPVCEHELEIVQELASAGSRNHQLVLEMIGQGAVLTGTEDPQLLIREYHLQQRQLQPSGAGVPAPLPAEAAEVLQLRDRFIATRIADTLGEGKTGLLFLGAAHQVCATWPCDLKVETLD